METLSDTIHSDSLDIKKTERDALLCLCLLLITSSSEVSLFKRSISMYNKNALSSVESRLFVDTIRSEEVNRA